MEPMAPVRPLSRERHEVARDAASRGHPAGRRGRRPSAIWLIPLAGLALTSAALWRYAGARRAAAATEGPTPAALAPSARARRPPRLSPALVAKMGEAPVPAPPPPIWQVFKDKFEAEGVDRQWSAKTTAAIRKVVAELAIPGTSLASVRCAETVCEVVFDHADKEAQLAAPYSLTKGPFASGTHLHYEGLRTAAYVQHE
jgi:hypothetical protein